MNDAEPGNAVEEVKEVEDEVEEEVEEEADDGDANDEAVGAVLVAPC